MRTLSVIGLGIATCWMMILGSGPYAIAMNCENTADSSEAGQLSVELELSATHGELLYEEPFQVVLINNGDRPINILRPDSRTAGSRITITLTNMTTGRTFIARPAMPLDFAARREDAKSGISVVEILSKARLSFDVYFDSSQGGEEGLPAPNTTEKFLATVQFESEVPPELDQRKIWTGNVSSQPVETRFVALRINTPHLYLWNGFPQRAIDIMQADPKWVSTQDKEECQPLHHASRFRHLAAVEWLLENGADVNAEAYNRFTPLYFADRPNIVKAMLQYHPDLTKQTGDGLPLQHALEKSSEARTDEDRKNWEVIADLYLEAGAVYDPISAIFKDDLRRVKEILTASPALADNFQSQSLLRVAAKLGRLEICRYLIESHHVDINDFERGIGYPIIKEALDHPPVVKLLIDHDVDLETRITWQGFRSGFWIVGDNATALHYAGEKDRPETVQLLIDAGVDIFATSHDILRKTDEQTALDVAAYFGTVENMSILLQHPKFSESNLKLRQAILDRCLAQGGIPSGFSKHSDRSRLVAMLLEKGANPHSRIGGLTALQHVVEQFHPSSRDENKEIQEVIDVLKKHGAKVDLCSAVSMGDEAEVARLLQEDPLNINVSQSDGFPALHIAVIRNYRGIVKQLLDAGCDIEVRNKSEDSGSMDQTALHCAAFWERDEIARELIERAANTDARDINGETPLDSATDKESFRKVLRESRRK